ncbi:MarR family transcriptional regulator [Intrasporangium sp.]|uniref:MarR family winged helix-turn-helix transcriptional regulator n=1 Tax=Intrasporangium sp. TaxID=1925024 RepID=UPI003221CE5E
MSGKVGMAVEQRDEQRDEQLDEVRWLDARQQASWRAILRGTRLLEGALDGALRGNGVQLSEYEILSMLSEAPERRLRMSELAAMVVQSRSRLTHTAKRLEDRGMVMRESCLDDKRGVELSLTPTGVETIERLSRVHVQSVRDHLVDLLTPAQFAAIGDAMAIVRDHLDPEGRSGR